MLAQFAELHPEAQLYARVAGTAELLGLLERRQLDIVLGFAGASDTAAIAQADMAWYGNPDLLRRAVLPLAVLEQPCRFRDAAIRALDEAERPYRIAVETPNLTTLRAAVSAGLGVTCRTRLFLRDEPLPAEALPKLPRVSCVLHMTTPLDTVTNRLADLARATIAAL
jgi:DNA-binding transcriptional LysR family regulator